MIFQINMNAPGAINIHYPMYFKGQFVPYPICGKKTFYILTELEYLVTCELCQKNLAFHTDN